MNASNPGVRIEPRRPAAQHPLRRVRYAIPRVSLSTRVMPEVRTAIERAALEQDVSISRIIVDLVEPQADRFDDLACRCTTQMTGRRGVRVQIGASFPRPLAIRIVNAALEAGVSRAQVIAAAIEATLVNLPPVPQDECRSCAFCAAPAGRDPACPRCVVEILDGDRALRGLSRLVDDELVVRRLAAVRRRRPA